MHSRQRGKRKRNPINDKRKKSEANRVEYPGRITYRRVSAPRSGPVAADGPEGRRGGRRRPARQAGRGRRGPVAAAQGPLPLSTSRPDDDGRGRGRRGRERRVRHFSLTALRAQGVQGAQGAQVVQGAQVSGRRHWHRFLSIRSNTRNVMHTSLHRVVQETFS
jgi:hypothetical protein